MLRRFAPKVRAPLAVRAPLMTSQRRNIEILSTWYLSSLMLMWYWTYVSFMPMFMMDFLKPSVVANKIPMLHFFQEKRTEMKLQAYLDDIATEWNDSIDAASYDNVIARSILP